MNKNKIVYWGLTGLIALVFIGSSMGKFFSDSNEINESLKYGLDSFKLKAIGVVELICVILYIIPRTGILGTLLLSAYMGGAIVTHLEHSEPFYFQIIIEAIIWLIAIYRFPELKARLFNSKKE